MTKMIFVNLPVTDLKRSIAFYKALGFEQNLQFSDDTAACMVWSEAIHAMLLTHAKWHTFTERPIPPAGTSGVMLTLSMDSREEVDRMNRAAEENGGQADVNPVQDLGFMYGRDLADPDENLWGAVWMDPAAFSAPEPAPALERRRWSVDIAAPASRVYEALIGPDSYAAWTSAFGNGLYFEGAWREGERMRFLTPGRDGVVSEIAENRPNEFLSIRHVGYIVGGVEDTVSEAVRAWAPAYENYTFTATPQGTTLIVDQDMTDEFKEMAQAWPEALARLKVVCENLSSWRQQTRQ